MRTVNSLYFGVSPGSARYGRARVYAVAKRQLGGAVFRAHGLRSDVEEGGVGDAAHAMPGGRVTGGTLRCRPMALAMSLKDTACPAVATLKALRPTRERVGLTERHVPLRAARTARSSC